MSRWRNVGIQAESVLPGGDGVQLAPQRPQPARHGDGAEDADVGGEAAHRVLAPAPAAARSAQVGLARVEEVVNVVGDVLEPAEPVADGAVAARLGVREHVPDGGELGLHGLHFRSVLNLLSSASSPQTEETSLGSTSLTMLDARQSPLRHGRSLNL